MTTSLQRGMVTRSADSACLYGTHKYYKTRTRFCSGSPEYSRSEGASADPMIVVQQVKATALQQHCLYSIARYMC